MRSFKRKQRGFFGYLYLLWIVPLVLLPTLTLQDKIIKHRLTSELNELSETTTALLKHWADRPISRLEPSTCNFITPGFSSYTESTRTQYLNALRFTSLNAFDRQIFSDLSVDLTLFEVQPPTTPLSITYEEAFSIEMKLRNKWSHLLIAHLMHDNVIDNKIDITDNMNINFNFRKRMFTLTRVGDDIRISSLRSGSTNNYANLFSTTNAVHTMSYINANNQFITGNNSSATVNPCNII